jgi:phage tail sheath protein FI
MPVIPTYPGVYIEEIPSGVHTITGVATSITAFIGQAARGEINEPVVINNFGDFERLFGGLTDDSMLSYAVRDFYLNGGNQALIIRIVNGATSARISLPTGAATPNNFLLLDAASPGKWGNNLTALVDYNTKDKNDPSPDINLFNLTITETGGATEKFLNVSVIPTDPRFLPRVLEQSSLLVAVPVDNTGAFIMPNVRPRETLVIVSPPMSPSATKPRPVGPSTPGSDGSPLTATQYLGSQSGKSGIFALEKADLFNLLCIPPPARGADTAATVYQAAMAYCVDRRAMLIVDPPAAWGARPEIAAANAKAGLPALGLSGAAARNAALYFPLVTEADPNREFQLDNFVACGTIAGIMARTDSSRGVWKAPAGLEATLTGAAGLQVRLTDDENGELNPLGINCLRAFNVNGTVVWGARTLRGADQFGDEYKYVPVRRVALFIEESLYRGTQWAVFEPNDEPLWSQIRLNVGAFMQDLFLKGAFQGRTPREAYLVKCDKETTTQTDINNGIVNILVGFAPLKPAEFVIIKIQQLAGQVAV